MAEKVDLYKLYADEYKAGQNPAFVEVCPAWYLGIEGQGAPGGESFGHRLGALYSVAFTIKMASKFAGQDYAVSKLEGLWWGSQGEDMMEEPTDQWNWKLLIRIPAFITGEDRFVALETLRKRGKDEYVEEVRIEQLEEGRCVQLLHVGPYTEERENINRMRDFARENGFEFRGLHHEIYLSDPRRVAPEKLRTILRHPVRKANV